MKYYFLGIAGTAMASLAVLLKQKGHEVWGTDQNLYPPMSDLLSTNRITVFTGYDPDHLNQEFDQVIIGNALSRGNVEVEEILNRRLPFISLPQLIYQEFLKTQKSVVITGTHGKTTTTGLLSWVLDSASLSPSFLAGGILKNYESSIKLGEGEYFVIEGDEYDTAFFDKRPKFLHYFPHILIINNIEFDHSDIYRDINQIKDEFKKLVRIVPANGLIIANGDDKNVREVLTSAYTRVWFFGKSAENDWSFKIVDQDSGKSTFQVLKNSKTFYQFNLPMLGEHQIYNSVAVGAAAAFIGLSPEEIQNGLNGFQGVKRRLELWGQLNNAEFYDDFAHHPTAIKETLKALHNKYPNKKIMAIFEPRTNTTIKNIFQKELAKALAYADIVMILPIHRPDKIPVEERLSLEQLSEDLIQNNRTVYLLENYEEIIPSLKNILDNSMVSVLLTNGDVGGQYGNMRKLISKK